MAEGSEVVALRDESCGNKGIFGSNFLAMDAGSTVTACLSSTQHGTPGSPGSPGSSWKGVLLTGAVASWFLRDAKALRRPRVTSVFYSTRNSHKGFHVVFILLVHFVEYSTYGRP